MKMLRELESGKWNNGVNRSEGSDVPSAWDPVSTMCCSYGMQTWAASLFLPPGSKLSVFCRDLGSG